MHVLAINSGSSSIKFRLFLVAGERPLISGEVDRIGEKHGYSVFYKYSDQGNIEEYQEDRPFKDHAEGLKHIFQFMEQNSSLYKKEQLYAVGHRVVHGGTTFRYPTVINDDVIRKIRDMFPLAPLHNPANLLGIEAVSQLCPDVPQVAVFDTAFFHALPPHVYHYALPNHLSQNIIRRFGFHGISHQYVAHETAAHIQRPLETLRMITLHLGNGASAAAIHKGVCIDTSMGMTPLEGLVMGTRCGDIDPSITFYLARNLYMNIEEIEEMYNEKSGLKGLCGARDMREVHRLANDGSEDAQLAIDMYCYRITKYVGAYHAILEGLDALVFTAGIGEHDPEIRQLVCDRLSVLGISIDRIRNHESIDQAMIISDKDSKIKVLVVPTNEELEIARQAIAVVN